jgi:hypothetical protein
MDWTKVVRVKPARIKKRLYPTTVAITSFEFHDGPAMR